VIPSEKGRFLHEGERRNEPRKTAESIKGSEHIGVIGDPSTGSGTGSAFSAMKGVA
jgi:hypothetical protein